MTSMGGEAVADRYTYGDVARIPAFRKLWLGDIASQTADRMALVAITILAYGEAASSMDVSLIIGAYFLPAIFISIPGGIAADRYPRRTVMVAAEGIRILVAILMAFLGAGLMLIGMVLVFSSLTYFFYPSRQAAIPTLVPDEALMPANAAISANLILGFAIGPPLAGVLATTYGADLALFSAAIVMAVGVVIIASINVNAVTTPARTGPEGRGSSLSEGLGDIKDRTSLLHGFILLAFVMLAVGAGAVGLVVFGDVHLGMGEEGFSLLLSALAVGTLVGALLVGGVGQGYPKERMLIVATIMAGVMLLLLTEVDDTSVAFGIMFLVGIAAAMVLVPFTTMLQEQMGDHVMGTSFGLLSMGLTAPMLVGIAIAGPFIDVKGVLDLFFLMGLVLLLVGLLSLAAFNLWKVRSD
jgi:MFS family permease